MCSRQNSLQYNWIKNDMFGIAFRVLW